MPVDFIQFFLILRCWSRRRKSYFWLWSLWCFFPLSVFFFNCFFFTLSLKKAIKKKYFNLSERSKNLDFDACFCRWGQLVLLVCKLTGKLLSMQYKLKGHVLNFLSLYRKYSKNAQKDFPGATWKKVRSGKTTSFMFFAHKET